MSKPITKPNAEGGWWYWLANSNKRCYAEIRRNEQGHLVVAIPGVDDTDYLSEFTRRYTWLGPVNPEPLPMPYEDES